MEGERFTIDGKEYQICNKIGNGGYATAYKGTIMNLDGSDLRHVVFKVIDDCTWDHYFLHIFPACQDVRRMLREAGIGEDIMVDHVIDLTGDGIVVQTYADGINLQDAVKTGNITLADLKRTVRDLSAKLFSVADAGAVHTDVKPENVIVKPGDTGISQPILVDIDGLQRIGTLDRRNYCTTREYAPPEFKQFGKVFRTSDIFSLGVTTMCSLRGLIPPLIMKYFNPDEGRYNRTAMLSDRQRRLADTQDEKTTYQLYAFVDAATRVDAAARPQTATEALQILDSTPNISE